MEDNAGEGGIGLIYDPMKTQRLPEENSRLKAKYRLTSLFYDLLDYPWERQYRLWRPGILQDVHGRVFEAGVGTGRNLPFYASGVELTAIDLSEGMLRQAGKRVAIARCRVALEQCDAVDLHRFPTESFDWYISTFMYCVMPDRLQPSALREMARLLKPGGRFRLIEMVYSKEEALRRRQEILAPFVECVYGARFDRDTLGHISAMRDVRVDRVSFLKADTYLLIEGSKFRR